MHSFVPTWMFSHSNKLSCPMNRAAEETLYLVAIESQVSPATVVYLMLDVHESAGLYGSIVGCRGSGISVGMLRLYFELMYLSWDWKLMSYSE